MSKHFLLAAAAAASLFASGAQAQSWTVRPEWVLAHETFLAGPELRGRGSATPDEEVAAAYVASQFLGFGLRHAPGMDSYLQKAEIVRLRLSGPAALTVDGAAIADPLVMIGAAQGVSGKITIFDGKYAAKLPAGEVVVATGGISPIELYRAARGKGVKLVIVPANDETAQLYKGLGGKARMPVYMSGAEPEGGAALVVLPAAIMATLAKRPGAVAALTLPVAKDVSTTTNAIGFLPGADAKAGVLLVTAHLDHLGIKPDGTMMPGANDDASGTTAVLELARALSAAKQTKRGILFVAYGAEEIGGYGSRYFGAHPPVPLTDIVANLEIEMIGAQDPKLPAGTMMMTGYERSTLGETLKAHGALVTTDPYPDQHFFQRSDNYSLALKGVVAHTVSGWAVTPTYHSANDAVANLDIAFMARAIQSLVEPLHSLADSDAKPQWKPGGQPTE